MNLKSFNKEDAFRKLFKEMDAMSKLTDVSDQILRYVKLADLLESIAIKAYEEGFKDAVDQNLNNPN